MAATLNVDASGNVTYTGSGSVANVLRVSVSGTAYTFNDAAETITVTGTTSGWTGTGTNTVTSPSATVTTIATNFGIHANSTLNLQSTKVPLQHTNSVNNTVNLCSNAPTNTGNLIGIDADLTFVTTGGGISIIALNSSASSGVDSNIVVGADTVTGLIGPTSNRTINFTRSGGTYSLNLTLSNSSTLVEQITYNSSNAVSNTLTTQQGNCTINVAGNASILSVTGGSGVETIVVGTAAGAVAGCDAIAAVTTTLRGAGGANSFRMDDTGSSTGSKTYTITPAATQAAIGTVGGLGSAGNSTVGYSASGGSFSGGWRLDGSSVGGNKFTVASGQFLDNAILAGNGSNNVADISGITAGWTMVDNGGGSFTVTQQNTKTISITAATVTPYIASIPAPTGTAAVGSTLTAASDGTIGGGSITRAYRWRYGDTLDVIAFATSSTYVPVSGDVGHTLQDGVTPTNAGGAGAEVWSAATAAVTAADSSSPITHGINLGVRMGL